MRQEDFLLKEIEKIGAILSAIRLRLFGGKEELAIIIEKETEDLKGQLLNETDFDLNQFLSLNVEDSNEYLSHFKTFGISNLELLAEVISQMGFNSKSGDSQTYFEKAIMLYEFCETMDKTYSPDREASIDRLRKALD